MEKDEQKIEDFLKKEITNIKPSYMLFESALNSVTENDMHRNSTMKAGIPSPYSFNYSLFMKKIAIIGIPLVVIAFLAITVMNPKKDELATNTIKTNNDLSIDQKAEVAKDKESIKDASVDNIIDSFSIESDSEASLATDSSDQAMMDEELESFNSLKTTSYENNI